MNSKILILVGTVFFLQSCIVPVKRNYEGLSKSLVFTDNKKWLINNIYSDLGSDSRAEMNKETFDVFEKLTKGNAFTLEQARKENLLTSKISFSPTLEELGVLKENTDFSFLVNSYTEKVRDQIAGLEIDLPLNYSKNEAFAIVEVYDLNTLKRIYFQKASSEQSLEKKQIANEYGNSNQREEQAGGPYLNFTARQLTKKNLHKILKDIEENAVK